ncbi:MAG: membrane protein insertase YidC [Alphaproteobacteria bacterium]
MIDQRNLVIAIVLSIVVILAWSVLYDLPRIERERARQQQAVEQQIGERPTAETGQPTAPTPADAPPPAPTTAAAEPEPAVDRAMLLEAGPRVAIASPRLEGSISLTGARIDDLSLIDYRVTVEPDSPEIILLSPSQAPDAYFADFGWAADDPSVVLPRADTVWQADGEILGLDQPLTLTWDNGQGLTFIQSYAIDENYLFTVTQRVENTGAASLTLFPYGRISRTGTPEVIPWWFMHEGPVGVLNGTLKEAYYNDETCWFSCLNVQGEEQIQETSAGGWIGIKDQYWLVALVPDQGSEFKARFTYRNPGQGIDKYQVDYVEQGGQVLAPGAAIQTTSHLFAGAKEIRVLEGYSEELGVERFRMAIDFTKFYFLTIPLHKVLLFFYEHLGNYGLAIILLTVIIKLVFFPLANRSYRAMSRMKKLQPKMVKIRERFKDDKQRMNQELMALYKREKANPVSGCLPILIQIPVFIGLYIVLFVTIEMRHAPFYLWVKDLAAPDPLGMLTLFGLFDWEPSGLVAAINIGVWPIIMGLTMYLQMKLNPQPADPVQAKLFAILPIVFTFILAQFPVGLVIYWAWNNLLSIAQQWMIMKRAGALRPS